MQNAARLVLALLPWCAPAATFLPHTVASGLKGGYQVIAADLNHDGKPDLIALAPGTNELVWFENPGWQRHVIISNVPRMINCAAWDLDGDGIPEIALAYEFSNDAAKSLGIVAILRHNGDPAQPWTAMEIDRLPTSHRLRWAKLAGSAKPVLLNAPLTNAAATHPEDRLPVPLVYYIPGEWKRRTTVPGNEGVQHGIFVAGENILTASMSGLAQIERRRNGAWHRTLLHEGSPAAWPRSGSSDVAAGRTAKRPFLAAIEPWHGNQVAVYRKQRGHWQREVIGENLTDGHTLITADFDGNGQDMILAGARGGDRSLHLYRWTANRWAETLLDKGNMAAAACTAADLNQDGRPDFACISPVTQELRWYENQRKPKPAFSELRHD